MPDQDQVDAAAQAAPGDSSTPTDANGISSGPALDPEHFDPDKDNLIETVDLDEIGGVDISTGGARDQKPDTKPATKDKAEPDKKIEPDKKEDLEPEKTDDDKPVAKTADQEPDKKPEPFHKHPDWQRMVHERNTALNQVKSLTDRIDALEKAGTKLPEKAVDFLNLSTDEIADKLDTDPKGFIQDLQNSFNSALAAATDKVKNDIKSDLTENQQQAKIDETYDVYTKDNPDNDGGTGFLQMWNAGQLQTFIDQHPGHTPISAHMALTAENRSQSIQQQIDAAVEKARKEERAKIKKEQEARVRTDGLSSAPTYTPISKDEELKDTKKKGGLVNVLAGKLSKMRQGAT
jgi:hypothetical protein